ncbi:MAG: hypothetical protein K9H64_01475 [Bacteroidales bacterium]|nr:hypothetical protein [Bacteroidales bacterium]MCF8454574.1 hypothetical protein [Bacteroidales bacterium]
MRKIEKIKRVQSSEFKVMIYSGGLFASIHSVGSEKARLIISFGYVFDILGILKNSLYY